MKLFIKRGECPFNPTEHMFMFVDLVELKQMYT